MSKQFRKKPVVVEAVQFTGRGSEDECLAFISPEYVASYNMAGNPETTPIKLHTLEGVMEASPGDWIIKGVQGEFYPCKPDIFEQTYEAVEPGVSNE